ncbi:MAG TPA: hypothetical protein PLX33_04355 [Alphaproteobacteria bacterium]|nr:hypothetical protein [Alphaproteobacteria bacterium]
MNSITSKIATICGCINHCFAFELWCEDFASVIGEDVIYVDEAFEIVSASTLLHSFLALRKLDDFLGAIQPKPGDLTSDRMGIDKAVVLGIGKNTLLLDADRNSINKGVAHLTEHLTAEQDSEVDLLRITSASISIFERLISELKKMDSSGEDKYYISQTEALVERFRTP